MFTYIYLYSYIFVSICVVANLFTIIIEEGFMKQKYDNDYTWLLQHTRKHLGLDDSSKSLKAMDSQNKKDDSDPDNEGDLDNLNPQFDDGINVDSDVIVSEFRLLFLRYQEQIKLYKEAIANLSLKQIINNEEESWIYHKEKQAINKNKKKL